MYTARQQLFFLASIVPYLSEIATPETGEIVDPGNSSEKEAPHLNPRVKNILLALALALSVWLALRYLMPILFPFLLGTGLALLAEPGVKFLCSRVRLPRAVSCGICVSLVFCGICALTASVLALVLRQLSALSGILPDMAEAAGSGMASLRDWLLSLAEKAPEELRPALENGAASLFSGGAALLTRGVEFLLGLAGGILRHVPDSALSLGTAVISGYMISAKLPVIREKAGALLSRERLKDLFTTLSRIRTAAGGWLAAQTKLAGITFLILTAGFLLLRIPYAPLWALGVSLVDAFPVLGTGTVLLPWAFICLIQGDIPRAVGLAGVYVTASVSRSILEPKLVGRHLGLDSLTTLLILYAGYRLWGIGGMLLAPMLAVAAKQLTAGS